MNVLNVKTNTNPINQTQFASRNIVIRRADDMARLVNKEYPRISATYFYDILHKKSNYNRFSLINNFKKLSMKNRSLNRLVDKVILRLNIKNRALRLSIDEFMNQGSSEIYQLQNITRLIGYSQSGNCKESTILSYIIAKLNGLKDIRVAYLKADNKEIDHMFLLVNDKKPYIIDAWLGFADYVPNTIQRYKNEFSHHFIKENKLKDKISVKMGLIPKIENIPIEILKKYYYNLLLSKNVGEKNTEKLINEIPDERLYKFYDGLKRYLSENKSLK